MKFIETPIEGLWVIEPVRHGDERGYLMEAFRADEFAAHVGAVTFVQDNESVSRRGVLRGMHLQKGEWAQAKLVRVSRGEVYDVVVDLRPGSKTYGRWHGELLSAANCRQMFVPRGFAHGFLVMSDEAQFQYKVDNVYAPQSEASLRWDDPDVGIEWPDPGCELLLSAKDTAAVPLSELKL